MDIPRWSVHAAGVEAVATDHAVGAESEPNPVVGCGEAVVFDAVAAVEDDHVFEAALEPQFGGAEHGEVVGSFGFGLRVASEEDADGVFREEGFRVSAGAGCGAVGGGAGGEEER